MISERLVELVAQPYERASAIRGVFDRSEVRPVGVRPVSDLVRLAVTDEVDLCVEVDDAPQWLDVETAVRQACTAVTRLRSGQVPQVPRVSLAADYPLLRNKRDQ